MSPAEHARSIGIELNPPENIPARLSSIEEHVSALLYESRRNERRERLRDRRFPRMEHRIDGVERVLDQVNIRVEEIVSAVERSGGRLTNFVRRVDRVEIQMEHLEVRMENLETRFDKLEVRMEKLEQGFVDLKNEMVQNYRALEKRITDIHDALTMHTRWMFGILGSLLLLLLTFSGGIFVKLMLG